MMALALALFAGDCSGVMSGSKGPPPTYDLSAAENFPRATRAPRAQIIIPEATALSVLDSERIIVRPAEGEITALADAQWSDRLTRLVQIRTIQTFENARRLRAVGRPGEHIAADYQLLLDIRAFEISVPAGPAAEVEISAKLVSDSSGRITAARVFRALVPAGAAQGPPAINALDQAFGQVATEIVLWASKII